MAEEPALEIIFRYLMLLFNAPDGLKVFVPSNNHRAVLRDFATDMVVPLSQASIRVEVDGAPAAAEATTLDPKDLLVSLEQTLKLKTPIGAEQITALDTTTAPITNSLHAIVDLPGGSITAFPSEAFPEKAEDLVKFVFGAGNVLKTKVTDTTFYKKPLPANGSRIDLVIETPRRTVRLDITNGGRFELRNEDEKLGPTPNMQDYHAQELADVLNLIGEAGTIQCDTFSCGSFYCGDLQGIFKN
jgi:hypothetical protein